MTRIKERIENILKEINTIEADLKSLNFEGFQSAYRATCFSISQIGENMSKLEEYLE